MEKDQGQTPKNTDESLKARGFIKAEPTGKGYGFLLARPAPTPADRASPAPSLPRLRIRSRGLMSRDPGR